MPGIGTLINVATVLLGGTLGVLLGARLPEKMRGTIMDGLGLLTLAIGVRLLLETEQILVTLGSLLLGGIVGELIGIEDRLDRLGKWLERRTIDTGENAIPITNRPSAGRVGSRFSYAFLTASLLYCVGPMTILGSIQDGLHHDYTLLAVKAVMDGFASLAFASTLGPGVIFSALSVLVYQGLLTVTASWASAWLSDAMIAEMTGTGGVLLLALGLGLLEIKRIRAGNLLPAILFAPLLVALATWAGLL